MADFENILLKIYSICIYVNVYGYRSKILNSSGAVHFILTAIEIDYYCCRIEFVVLKPVLQDKLLSDQNTIKMKRKVRRIHWYTAEKEKTNDTKVIKDQTYCIFN